MKKSIKLSVFNALENEMRARPGFIHVVLGPRQVGKTTGVQQITGNLSQDDFLYSSADGIVGKTAVWFEEQWNLLKQKNPNGLLIIDEIQKVEGWSEVVKKDWDRQKNQKSKIKLILLGSSSLDIQTGLRESLTGRFVVHKVHQWNYEESANAYRLNLDQFMRYGGYPGSYEFIEDRARWLSYLKESIIDTVVGKDILHVARVKSPALFRQCFDLVSAYGGQEISYTKLLGQLQDRGNVELVKHYLELFEGAFLMKQLYKYSEKATLRRSSSPKILPLAPALYSITQDADLDSETWGRSFEIAIGCELNRKPGQLFYWREKNNEVDFIYKYGRHLFAIEVKSGRKKSSRGLLEFQKQFPKSQALIVTPESFQKDLKNLDIK